MSTPAPNANRMLLWAGAIALFGFGAGVGFRASWSPSETAGWASRSDASKPAEPSAPPPQAPAHHPNMREQMERAIANLPEITKEEVPAYLDALADQARRRGTVTALEIGPGKALIERHGLGIDAQVAFTSRMEALQQELSARAPEPSAPEATAPPSSPDEVQRQLDALLGELRSREGTTKQALIRRYLELANHLDAEAHLEATRALDEAVTQRPPPADQDSDAL